MSVIDVPAHASQGRGMSVDYAELLRPFGLEDVRQALLRQSDRLSALSGDWIRAAVVLRGQL